ICIAFVIFRVAFTEAMRLRISLRLAICLLFFHLTLSSRPKRICAKSRTQSSYPSGNWVPDRPAGRPG
ncbi:MAG: hypothetical protein ABWZ86_01075, partial [Hyphomicrobium sp.]